MWRSKKEIEAKAREKEQERDEKLVESDHLLHAHHGFANAVAIFQVSIALGAVAALTRSPGRLARLAPARRRRSRAPRGNPGAVSTCVTKPSECASRAGGRDVLGRSAGTAGRIQRVVIGIAPGLPLRDRRFDRVAASLVLSHVERYDTALRDMLRVLKPGGRLDVSAAAKSPNRPNVGTRWARCPQ